MSDCNIHSWSIMRCDAKRVLNYHFFFIKVINPDSSIATTDTIIWECSSLLWRTYTVDSWSYAKYFICNVTYHCCFQVRQARFNNFTYIMHKRLYISIQLWKSQLTLGTNTRSTQIESHSYHLKKFLRFVVRVMGTHVVVCRWTIRLSCL